MAINAYLDNAATTPIDKEVLDAMLPYMETHFGNPSSIHAFGWETRAAIERSRRSIAQYFNVSPGEIFFTSGGTEANNMALRCSVESLGIKTVISSRIEHHAVIHTLEMLENKGLVKVLWVRLNKKGVIDLQHLEQLLEKNKGSLVSLMHANNEIGNLLPIKKVGDLCAEYHAVFHSDTVQTMGHYVLDFQKVKALMASCSAHKFHGPKSTGFLYLSGNLRINPLIYGGPQERNMRGGTENVYGIVGMAKAFEIAYRNIKKDQAYIRDLKSYLIDLLNAAIPGIKYNGESAEKSLYTVLNISLPSVKNKEMLLFNLDIAGIAVSGGSACSSGVSQDSHVLSAIGCDMKKPSIRVSLSKLNTRTEIEYFVEQLKIFQLV